MPNRPERIYVYNEPRGELAIDLKPGNADEPPDTEYIRADVARAIEREATAEATRIMRAIILIDDEDTSDFEFCVRLDPLIGEIREYLERMK